MTPEEIKAMMLNKRFRYSSDTRWAWIEATDKERRRCLDAVEDEPECVENPGLQSVQMSIRDAKQNIIERIRT